MKLLLILLFALPALGQDLSEIRGKKIYVLTDNVRAVVEKELPRMTVTDPKDAEVFVEYKTLLRGMSDAVAGGLVVGTYEHGEMNVFYKQDQKQIVVWSRTAYGSPYHVPKKLAKQFRVALRSSQNKKPLTHSR